MGVIPTFFGDMMSLIVGSFTPPVMKPYNIRDPRLLVELQEPMLKESLLIVVHALPSSREPYVRDLISHRSFFLDSAANTLEGCR